MPRPANWREVGVPSDIPTYITESELCRRLGLSPYAGYRLRRINEIVPVARTGKTLLYPPEVLTYLEQFRSTVGSRSYLAINGEDIW